MVKNTLDKKLNVLLANESSASSLTLCDSEETLHYDQIRERVLRILMGLESYGLKRGDKILYSLSKDVNQACLIIACYYAGFVFVPLLPNQSYANTEHIINDCKPDIIVAEGLSADSSYRKIKMSDLLVFNFENVNYSNYNVALQDDLAAIIYSSGSTGRPKGICFSRRNISDGAEIVSEYTNIIDSDVILSPLSLNFDYGLNQLWVSVLSDCKLILHEFSYSLMFMQLVEKHKPTVIPLMPVFIGSIIDPRLSNKLKGYITGSVRLITTSGGAVSRKYQEEITNLFSTADLMLMYGLTEAFRSTFLAPSERLKRSGSIGKAIPGARVWVGGENFEKLPAHSVGEIFHEGGCMSLGYWNNAEKTAVRFKDHPNLPNKKILSTGDLGYQDEDGFIYFVGRKDEMIKSRGHRISPFEIEVEVVKFPNIQAAVVTSKADDLHTNLIVLAYTVTPGAKISEQDLKLFLSKSLAPHQVPDAFIKLEEFPTTGNQGKVDRLSVHKICMDFV